MHSKNNKSIASFNLLASDIHLEGILHTINTSCTHLYEKIMYYFSHQSWLSDVELLAILVAAMIHDYEHTGTTNNFHIMTS